MEAIILAGGKGTRLQTVVSDLPKPMAPVAGVPFLVHVIRHLKNGGVTRAVLSIGHMKEKIETAFGSVFEGVEIDYCPEDTPLGTGGAIVKAVHMINGENAFVLNGDCFFGHDWRAQLEFHKALGADVTLGLKKLHDFDRYGTVDIRADGRVQSFREKAAMREGFINTGMYCMNKKAVLEKVKALKLPERFSIETDFFQPECLKMKLYGFVGDGSFIDIGIPEDYAHAQTMREFNTAARK